MNFFNYINDCRPQIQKIPMSMDLVKLVEAPQQKMHKKAHQWLMEYLSKKVFLMKI